MFARPAWRSAAWIDPAHKTVTSTWTAGGGLQQGHRLEWCHELCGYDRHVTEQGTLQRLWQL